MCRACCWLSYSDSAAISTTCGRLSSGFGCVPAAARSCRLSRVGARCCSRCAWTRADPAAGVKFALGCRLRASSPLELMASTRSATTKTRSPWLLMFRTPMLRYCTHMLLATPMYTSVSIPRSAHRFSNSRPLLQSPIKSWSAIFRSGCCRVQQGRFWHGRLGPHSQKSVGPGGGGAAHPPSSAPGAEAPLASPGVAARPCRNRPRRTARRPPGCPVVRRVQRLVHPRDEIGHAGCVRRAPVLVPHVDDHNRRAGWVGRVVVASWPDCHAHRDAAPSDVQGR